MKHVATQSLAPKFLGGFISLRSPAPADATSGGCLTNLSSLEQRLPAGSPPGQTGLAAMFGLFHTLHSSFTFNLESEHKSPVSTVS